jgi:osmotically-inducible protein OsmY
MRKLVWLTIVPIAVILLSAGAGHAATTPQTEEIRAALLRLPYYGVFDALSFSYDKGTVTLEGYAYRVGLKRAAERAVKRLAGVDEVVNNIVELPTSPHDDALRWRTFNAIYYNSALSRYAPDGGLSRYHYNRLRRDLMFGLQPIGSYPIHIVVERGQVRLIGTVDNQADRTIAELAARGVFGSFGVENQLAVRTRS